MIGQKRLQDLLFTQIAENKLPRFILFTGQKGSQKKELAAEIGRKLGILTIPVTDKSVDSIRDVVESSYTVKCDVLYIISDADNMSNAAKNTLLKVTEEPPNRVRFIVTVETLDNMLPTIISRAVVYNMDRITPEELKEYYTKKTGKHDADNSNILSIAETPHEIDLLIKYDIYEFISYVNKVIECIADVEGANAFKIADKINLSTDDSKYDLKLFWKAFMRICADNLLVDIDRYSSGVIITSKALKQLSTKGINKQMLFDNWILAIRNAWMEVEE